MVTFVPAIRRVAIWADEALRGVSEPVLQPYRCEQHYMRGPGPKWHAKHDPKPEGRAHKGPLTGTLDQIAHLHAMIAEARASLALLGAKPLLTRCHVSSKSNDDRPIAR